MIGIKVSIMISSIISFMMSTYPYRTPETHDMPTWVRCDMLPKDDTINMYSINSQSLEDASFRSNGLGPKHLIDFIDELTHFEKI